MTAQTEQRLPAALTMPSLYTIRRFTESSDRAGAIRAQQIQGESYMRDGFIRPGALENDGRLPHDLDRYRGWNVEYLLATRRERPDNLRDQGSVRVVHIPDTGRLSYLPAYRYAGNTLTREADEQLKLHYAAYGSAGVCEIAVLTRTVRSHPVVELELIRALLHDEWSRPRPRIWLVAFTDLSYRSVGDNFGAATVRRCGSPVTIGVGDHRMPAPIRLTPAVVDPCIVLDTMMDEILSTDDARTHATLMRTLRFLSQDAPPRQRELIDKFFTYELEVRKRF